MTYFVSSLAYPFQQEGPEPEYDPSDPSKPQYADLTPCAVAIGEEIFYSLTTIYGHGANPVLTLSSVPLKLNATMPSTLATLLPSDKKTWAFPSDLQCVERTIAMTANGSIVYVICSTEVRSCNHEQPLRWKVQEEW